MSIQPVSLTRHRNLRWLRFDDYRFAASTIVAPLAAAELVKAALAMPLAFIEHDGGWTLAAVLGLTPGQNLFVGQEGRWLTEYIPAQFRSHPFRIGWNETGEAVLCVDESSGLIKDGPDGEPFFNEAGEPSPVVAQAWAFLQNTAQSAAILAQACNTLHSVGVIEPWPVTIQREAGTHQLAGLNRINETALNALDDAAFGHLRQAGIVGIAYAQLLSMGNFGRLGQLAQARAQAEAAERARAEIKPMIMLPEDNTIDWDWSKIGKP